MTYSDYDLKFLDLKAEVFILLDNARHDPELSTDDFLKLILHRLPCEYEVIDHE